MHFFAIAPLARQASITVLVVCANVGLGCSGVEPGESLGYAGAPQVSQSVAGTAGVLAMMPAVRQHTTGCRAPSSVSNAPQSIAETVTLINALPKPLTLPCFLESLARPLEMSATFSVVSAQPAVGHRSPRVFLFLGPKVAIAGGNS